jgi:two-component system sensor histidine kinase/response regulator
VSVWSKTRNTQKKIFQQSGRYNDLIPYGSLDIKQNAREAGVDNFLIKPINQSVLLDAVVNHFYSHSNNLKSNQINHQNLNLQNMRGASVLLVEDNLLNQQVACELVG